MAAEERRKYGEAKALVVAIMSDGRWRSSTEVASACGILVTTAKYHLQRLTENGHLESDGKGGKGYRLRCDAAAKAAKAHIETGGHVGDASGSLVTDIDYSEAPTAPPAPAQGPNPEPPAEATPDTAPSGPESSAGFLPFAGLDFGVHELVAAPIDDELNILQGISDLEPDQREALLQYAVGRWWLR
jgi:hypothetical protein